MLMKAIETVYKGHRFRSRLEARWAVFFDTLGIAYEYEKEGFDLEGVYYLPDFWLPREKIWVEIKGDEPNDEEKQKAQLLSQMVFDGEDRSVIMLCGSPGDHHLYLWGGCRSMSIGELLQCPNCHHLLTEGLMHEDESEFFTNCENCDIGERDKTFERLKTNGLEWHKGFVKSFYDPRKITCRAIISARQARFEHGEAGAVNTRPFLPNNPATVASWKPLSLPQIARRVSSVKEKRNEDAS